MYFLWIWIFTFLDYSVIANNKSRIERTTHQITSHFMNAAKRDMTPSLRWAAIQVESLIPLPFVESLIENNIQLSIQSALIEYGIIVLRELEPGLTKAVVHLIQNHTADPDLPTLRFTKLEISNFVEELSDNWSGALKRSLNIWINHHLDSLIGVFTRILGNIGREILLKLGHALNTFRQRSRFITVENSDLYSNIKSTSKDVVSASFTFLHGAGWMTREMNVCLQDNHHTVDLLGFDFE